MNRAVTTPTIVPLQNSATTVGYVRGGLALDCVGVDKGAVVTAPDYLKFAAPPYTIHAVVRVLATPDVNTQWFGVTYDVGVTNPYVMYGLATDSGDRFCLNYNNGAFLQTVSPSLTGAGFVGRYVWMTATVTASAQSLYANGGVTVQASNSVTSISASATAQLCLGAYPNGVGRNGQCQFIEGRLYNRALSDSEVWQLYANPWDLYWVPGRRVFFDQGSTPAAGRTSRLAFMGVG